MFVQVFEKIRERKGWTKYKLAKELGISSTQLNYYENRAKSVNTRVLIRLRSVSGLSWGAFGELLEAEVRPK